LIQTSSTTKTTIACAYWTLNLHIISWFKWILPIHSSSTSGEAFLYPFASMADESKPAKNGPQAQIDPITVGEIASIAKTRIKKEFWDYYECGSDTQTVLHENEAAFKA
jgi:hypothetical protein